MPYANNHGVQIHFQVVGEGTPLLLLHGLYASLEDWEEAGYVAGLKHKYQLLLVDGRGHGASDKPHEPEAYALPLIVSDLVAVLDAAHIPKAHFLGYSWGGCIGFGVGQYAPERFLSLMIGGHAAQGGEPQTVAFFMEHLQGGVEAFTSMLDMIFEPSQAGYKTRRIPSDLAASTATMQAWGEYSGLEAALPTVTMPCLLYIGEADDQYALVKENAQYLPASRLVALAGLDHTQAFMRSDLVLPHITQFLSDVGEA